MKRMLCLMFVGSYQWQKETSKLFYMDGNVGIGTPVPNNKLDVNGTVYAKEVKVDLDAWLDYVFKKGYDLPTLDEVENYITNKGCLTNIPSE